MVKSLNKIAHPARLASFVYTEYTAFGYPHRLNDFLSNLGFVPLAWKGMDVIMKKLLLILTLCAICFTGCAKNDNLTPFEEIEKIDIEVSDYVEEETPTIDEKTETDSQDAVSEEDKSNSLTEQDAKTQESAAKTQDTNTQAKTDTVQTEKTTAPSAPKKETPVTLENKTVCIDAGHGTFSENREEPIAPISSHTKPAFSEGVQGALTTEDTVTLAVAKKLKEKLEGLGAKVVMTRTDDYATLSNAERAEFANNENADICIKLHADGTGENGKGMTALFVGSKYVYDKQLIADSKKLADCILKKASAKTGAKNRGIYSTSQMAGLNWSKIPAVIFEMGQMTNSSEEKKLADKDYQNLIARGIADGVLEYFK